MKLNILLLLMMCATAINQVQAQCLPEPADECTDIVPLVCELDGYCGETPSETTSLGTINCGAFGAELYGFTVIQFVATGEEVSLRIEFDNCNGVTPPGGAEEFGMTGFILPACPFDGLGAFDCDENLSQSGFLSLSIDDAIVGEYYTLAFTGNLGNVCSYEITVISGADPLPGLFESGNEIEGATAVCPGDIVTYFAPEVDGVEYYLFALSTGQFLETDVPELEIEWSGGLQEDSIYTLCVSAFNQCESLIDYACIDVLYGSQFEIEIEMELCAGEIFEAFGNEYIAPGEYIYESNSGGNCDTTAFIYLEAYEAPTVTAEITNDLGGNEGAIDITINGGTPPYEFSWSNGAVSEDISGLSEGEYINTITDGNGCTYEFVFNVELGTALSLVTKANSIPVSPNPAFTDQPVFIQSAELDNVQSIAYVNMQGQVTWKSAALHSTDSRMELPGISTPGLYQVRMIGKDGELSIGRVMVVSRQ
jgi:hypothetical protein